MGYKFKADKSAPYGIYGDIICGNLRDGDPQLSPHFQAHEFACPDCKEYRIAIAVLEGLENVRTRAGVPLYVAKTSLTSPNNTGGSGYRCPKHNKAVAGASNSMHLYGRAVDVHPTGALTVAALYSLMLAEPVFRSGGIGTYKTFVHGDNGPKRRWRG